MRRDMKPGDGLTLTLNGETHTFGPDQVKVQIVQTAGALGRGTIRYATLMVPLADEYPEDTSQITGGH